ncbi:MAG: hypothetical protein OS130_02935 [Thermodesulfobacteriota bacterium]|jgi:hypothetical protein|nr:MAG: hypothetical protein OS130_02935 [Thermodesulfobacteriota bacterium]
MDKNQAMHIALFIRSFSGSGDARFMVNMVRVLSDKGHCVDLVRGRKKGY